MFVTSAFAQSGEAVPAQGETHTGTEAAGGHEANFPPFDSSTFPSQLLWLAITFGLFYLFVKNTIVPRISGILENRREHIASDLDKAARIKQDADAAIAAYEQERVDARARANDVANKARDEARAEAEAERRKVETGLEARLAESERQIAAIKASAMKDVGAVAEDTAALIVERLLGSAAPRAGIAAAVKAAGK
jgi:F-type H+-transporting ATPase subunit b